MKPSENLEGGEKKQPEEEDEGGLSPHLGVRNPNKTVWFSFVFLCICVYTVRAVFSY